MAEESKKKSNVSTQYNVAATGLNLDNSQNNIKKGALSYALNAAVENYDSNSINYQNEPGNEECFEFPEGYVLVGKHFIPEQSKHIFFITNPDAGMSEIGYMVNNDCKYRRLVRAACLNFSVDSPIHKIVHKITNFGTELYWPDNNGRRYLDIDNIPYLADSTLALSEQNTGECDIDYTTQLDCNKLLLQPDMNIPLVNVSDVVSGGELTSGTYQFTVQYSDAIGNPYTSYYNVTNPVPIADTQTASVNFNLPVGKSIVVDVKNLNRLGQYQYFNLAVIATINGISTPYLVGTYFIDSTTKRITYTGQTVESQLSLNDIYERFTYYDKADYVTAVQDVLVWKGMTAVPRLNYQKIANKLKLKWATWRIPPSESFADEINANKYRGYLRDEVYAFEIIFLIQNGKETDGFHIPGRASTGTDTEDIDNTNSDITFDVNPNARNIQRWQVYNTATNEGFLIDYDPNDPDYKGPYQRGDMAYWKSTEEYPCDEERWGELSGEKIRHHKMPDVNVSPIFESSEFTVGGDLVSEDRAIFPLGIYLDPYVVEDAIRTSDLTDAEQAEIVGYKIVRADRGASKSIVAKGMLRNVGKYEKEEQTYYYPNYPYNDVANEDPFLNSINNAWTDLCEEWTIDIKNLPEQPEGGSYVKIEYVSCNTNKLVTKTFDSIGIKKVCSIGRPRFISAGDFNRAKAPITFPQSSAAFYDANWEDYIPKAANDVDVVCYPSNFDVYRINWKNYNAGAAGMRPQWDDYIEGIKTIWLTYRRNCIVAVPVGQVPVCTDESCFREASGNNKMRPPILIEEVRVKDCKAESPIESIKDIETEPVRQIFNSPETSFGQPFLGNVLKLESVMFGAGKAHFVEVKDNAKYKLLTKEAQADALYSAEKVGNITSNFAIPAMFSVYQSYLTIYINGITRKNYAYSYNSIASYNYSVPVPNDLEIKQRKIDTKKYLIPGVLSVGEENPINNYQRETSVFIKTNESLPYPHLSNEMLTTGVVESSRYVISGTGNCGAPQKENDISVVSYYGSLKNNVVNQYGQIYSYEQVDTGYVKIFRKYSSNDEFIFGGDTFIGKFAYKTKVPFFIDNRVNAPDDSDIFYDEIGNIAYPKYWHSSRSKLETYTGNASALILNNFISYKATNFDCPNDDRRGPDPDDFDYDNDDPEYYPERTFYDGYFYMFAYGIPSFYCESSYNLDLRTATNNKEGDFWPHVSTGIPDDWVQETNVTIAWDNVYNYNSTFSKQHKETVVTNLPADWGNEEDRNQYPFRAVYSDKQVTDADNRVNNWLTYRPVSYYDFPQNFGALIALDSLQNAAILARFENKSLLYNDLLTIDSSNPQSVYVGNANFFANPPIDYADTDLGYVGCQNKMLLKTPYGAISIDAKRGQVFLINGQKVEDLAAPGTGMNRWFTAHLPFEILKHYPAIETDNHYNGIGIHGVYDDNYERIILTKIDYIPIDSTIRYRDGKWWLPLESSGNQVSLEFDTGPEREIFLEDSDYFCNVSWTLSFNFVTKSWISFHSYIPNYYIGENNFFYSGMNACPNDFDALVGVFDETLTTTTTTTIKVLPSTTTTTTTTVVYDCEFDVNIALADCTLEGTAVVIGEPACTRPDKLDMDNFFKSYIIVVGGDEVAVDSTVSAEAACAHMNYYLIQDPTWEYNGEFVKVEREGLAVGALVFADNDTNDCTTIADGWYFSPITAEELNYVFRVESGIIVEINTCPSFEEGITTTTTTTTLEVLSYCFRGTKTEGDPLYPAGGVVSYFDENGDLQSVSEIWDVDEVNITASSILTSYAISICTTTTTTTTV